MEKIRKWLLISFAFVTFLLTIPQCQTFGYAAKHETWTQIANEMEGHLNDSVKEYKKGNGEEAKDKINIAYFQYYEKLGFEKTVKSYISGRRVKNIEYEFHEAKRMTNDPSDPKAFKAHIDTLVEHLKEDAKILDGDNGDDSASSSTSWVTFLASFGLTLREGLEAILVIAAILAYLYRISATHLIKGVYAGAGLGVAFSVLLAFLFNWLANSLGDTVSGQLQEVFEGVTMFVAVAVLFYVSNWMLSKSDTETWQRYIQDQVDVSISENSKWALVFSAFLAVAREGAELILFFQGLQLNQTTDKKYLWLGLIAALIVLAVVYYAITKWSVRLPLKPFFLATSALMFVLCFSFLGKGVGELQEADVLSKTIIPWMNGWSFEWLGIYDNYESFIPQIILLIITVGVYAYHFSQQNKLKKEYGK